MNTIDSGGYPVLVTRGDRTTAERAASLQAEVDAPRAQRPRTNGRVRLAVAGAAVAIAPQAYAYNVPVTSRAFFTFQVALFAGAAIALFVT